MSKNTRSASKQINANDMCWEVSNIHQCFTHNHSEYHAQFHLDFQGLNGYKGLKGMTDLVLIQSRGWICFFIVYNWWREGCCLLGWGVNNKPQCSTQRIPCSISSWFPMFNWVQWLTRNGRSVSLQENVKWILNAAVGNVLARRKMKHAAFNIPNCIYLLTAGTEYLISADIDAMDDEEKLLSLQMASFCATVWTKIGLSIFKDVMEDFLAFIAEYPLVSHNAPFDMRFLNAELSLFNKWLR